MRMSFRCSLPMDRDPDAPARIGLMAHGVQIGLCEQTLRKPGAFSKQQCGSVSRPRRPVWHRSRRASCMRFSTCLRKIFNGVRPDHFRQPVRTPDSFANCGDVLVAAGEFQRWGETTTPTPRRRSLNVEVAVAIPPRSASCEGRPVTPVFQPATGGPTGKSALRSVVHGKARYLACRTRMV